MKLVGRILCLFVAGSFVLRAQAIPNFSGTWKMDLSRSDAAAQGAPIAEMTVVIRQSSGEVRVEATRGGSIDVVRYLPVGTNVADARGVAGTFRWEGAQLVTSQGLDGVEVVAVHGCHEVSSTRSRRTYTGTIRLR